MGTTFDERDAFARTTPDLARRAAQGLGPDWRSEPGPHNTAGHIHGPNGEHLLITAATWKTTTHVEISVVYPEGTDGLTRLPYHKIKMAANRNLAKEIQRRLLAAYQEDLAKAKAALARHEDANAMRHERVKAIAERVSRDGRISVYNDDDSKRTTIYAQGFEEHVSGSLILHGNGTHVHLEFSGPSERLVEALYVIVGKA